MMKRRKLMFLILLLAAAFGLWPAKSYASIVLKAIVVNPSKVKTQTAILKAYLPKEAKPEDVIDMGDLKIDYDVEKALYYVYKKFELKPGQSVIRSVKIKDVWIIPKSEIDALTGRAKGLVEKLKKTVYSKTAVALRRDIEKKSLEIINKQRKAMNALPQTHIAVYRENVKTLNSIKNSLAEMDNMLIKVKLAAAELTRAKRVSVRTTWWVILIIILFLILLSIIFFIVWHRQAVITEKTEKEKEESESLPNPSGEDKEDKVE